MEFLLPPTSDLTAEFNELLRKRNAAPATARVDIEKADSFLKEAYRIVRLRRRRNIQAHLLILPELTHYHTTQGATRCTTSIPIDGAAPTNTNTSGARPAAGAHGPRARRGRRQRETDDPGAQREHPGCGRRGAAAARDGGGGGAQDIRQRARGAGVVGIGRQRRGRQDGGARGGRGARAADGDAP